MFLSLIPSFTNEVTYIMQYCPHPPFREKSHFMRKVFHLTSRRVHLMFMSLSLSLSMA